MTRRPRIVLCILSILVLSTAFTWTEVHRSGCHRWHSCPSDHGTYVCGDLGYCSQCPDNQYCQNGQARSAAPRTPPVAPTPTTPPPAARPPVTPSLPAAQVLTAPVIRVIDGDRIDVDIDGTREQVRYLGIDAPEARHPTLPPQPYGPEAEAANRRLVEGKTVRLEFDVQPRDGLGRLLAYVYVGDVMVNAELVRHGYAQIATFTPNVKYQERLRALQREAREAQRGLWGVK